MDEVGTIAEERADWLLDAVATATQNRMFLCGDPQYDESAGEAILLNGKKAIETSIARHRSQEVAELVGLLREARARIGFYPFCDLRDRIDAALSKHKGAGQ